MFPSTSYLYFCFSTGKLADEIRFYAEIRTENQDMINEALAANSKATSSSAHSDALGSSR